MTTSALQAGAGAVAIEGKGRAFLAEKVGVVKLARVRKCEGEEMGQHG